MLFHLFQSSFFNLLPFCNITCLTPFIQYTGAGGFPGSSSGKESACQVQEMQEMWVQPLGQEDSPGEENGKLPQDSCLGNPMDRGVWL